MSRFSAAIRHVLGSEASQPDAVIRLFEPEGALARYPGAAVIVDAAGSILAANTKADDVLADAAPGKATKLNRAVYQTLGEGIATAAVVHVPETEATIAVTVVPVGVAASGGPAQAALLLGQDMTLLRNLRAALTDSRQRYKDLAEISSDFAWEAGADGRLIFVSPRGAMGYRAEEMVGQDPSSLFVVEPHDETTLPFGAKTTREDVTVWARRADGSLACLLVSCVPVMTERGEWCGTRGVARDVTEARNRDAALARARAREQLLAYIVRQIRDEIVPQNMMNAAAATIGKGFGAVGCRIHRVRAGGGFAVAAEFGKIPSAPQAPLSALGTDQDRAEERSGGHAVLAIATRYRRRVNGAISLWREADSREFDSDDLGLLGEVANQIGIAIEQLANHEDLERLSRTDALTGLLNRRMFIEEMTRRLALSERSGRSGALCYLDLDNFKMVNDSQGHRSGDMALVAVANLLRGQTREADVVARLGGDEFAFWLDGADAEAAAAKARVMLGAAGTLANFSRKSGHALGFSIGIAVYEPGSKEPLDQLMGRADDVMYEVKKAGKGGVQTAPAPAVTQPVLRVSR